MILDFIYALWNIHRILVQTLNNGTIIELTLFLTKQLILDNYLILFKYVRDVIRISQSVVGFPTL